MSPHISPIPPPYLPHISPISRPYLAHISRRFNSEWRDMELKPVEMRTLRTPLSKMPQGKVELWVEMMTPEEARQVPTRYRGDIGGI